MIWSLQATPVLEPDDFEQWRKLLEDRTGVSMGLQQQAFLQAQITMRMRELGFTDYAEYYHRVTEGIWGKAEWSILVDRLMVKETSFFRHRHSYECVGRVLQQRIDAGEIKDSFDVWSVGCSTGEEPYSLAMLISDCFELAQLKPYFGVFASDVSLPALSRARAGVFTERKLECLSGHQRLRYFRDLGDGRYKIIDKLQDRLCFSQGNVMNLKAMPLEKMDVIFCQNVLIYFRRWRRKEILQEFAERLKPGGLLVIGLGEMSDWKPAQLKRVNDERVHAYLRY